MDLKTINLLLMRIFFAFLMLMLNASISFSEDKAILNIYNWSNYIDPVVVTEFEKKYDVKINYDLFDNNYVLETKLSFPNSGYDIVFPSSTPFLLRQAKLGIYEKLDFSKIPNYKYLDKQILEITKKQGDIIDYSVPYLWGTTGLGFNKKIKQDVLPNFKPNSLEIIFNKEIIKKFASCGVEIVDSPSEIIPMALIYYGKNPYDESLEDLKFISQKLAEIRPFVKSINAGSYIDNLASGESCVVLGFSGDIIQARNKTFEVNTGIEIEFYRPKEVFELSVDSMAILASATNKDLAYKFINWVLEPRNSALITNFTGYPNANIESKKYISPKILADDSVYFDIKNLDNIYIPMMATPEYEKARNRTWLNFIGNK